MNYQDFCKQAELRETKPNNKNNLIAEEIISSYLAKTGIDELSCQAEDPIEDLLYEYFFSKGTENEKLLNQLLNSYHFNYSMSIHNAIYHLLATENERVSTLNPLLWPGVNNIEQKESKYILETILGTIEVYKASEMFKESPSYHIFDKILMGKCYDRTYDFLKENNDYKAVLQYMPNFFYGGHFHAYLEKDECVLDIASNAFYSSSYSINKVLCGEILAKLTYQQTQQKFNEIKNAVPDIKNSPQLLTLALYYDKKKTN